MKITPIPQGAGAQQNVNPNEGRSASAEKIARAKAVAMGQQPSATEVPEVQETTTQKLRRIRMNTQATPAPRDWVPPQAEPIEAEPADISVLGEPAAAASEETIPLSPQFAALAKTKRALQVKESALQAREEALKVSQNSPQMIEAKTLIERMKADPLGLLLENGVTYDQLTQAVLRDMEGGGPALTRVETELRNEFKSLKEELRVKDEAQTNAKTEAEKRAEAFTQRQVDALVASDDAYQMIRETGSSKDVTTLISRVLKEEGETLTVQEAAELVENDLLEESLRFARIKKVQEKLQPTQQIQAAPPQDGVRRQTMRTLTNRDTVSAIPSRRDRAIAAAYGKKLA